MARSGGSRRDGERVWRKWLLMGGEVVDERSFGVLVGTDFLSL